MLFEFRKIVCPHSLLVLMQEMVTKAPEKYMLTKWRKYVSKKHTYIRVCYVGKEKQPHIQQYDKLCKRFYDKRKCECD